MKYITKQTTIWVVVGLCATLDCLSAGTNSRPASESTPIAFPNLDSDHDGLSDNVDPDPIIVNYTALRWEVTSVSLDYDVKQQLRLSQGASADRSSQASTRGTFSWLVGADGKVEGEARAKGRLSADPFELFGLRHSGSEIGAAIAASASARVQKGRSTDETEVSAMKDFLSISDEAAVGDLHLGFSVNIRSLSHSPLLMQLAPIPVLIAGRHVASATPSDVGTTSVIEIPADRLEGVLVSFRADINNTRAFDLVRCLRNGDSPTIDLARSRITIKAKNDISDVDLVSKITRIETDDCLLTVRTSGGSVAWRIAPTFGLRPVTLRQAMKAVNDLLRREAHVERDFFDFGPSGLKTIASFMEDDVWLQTDGQKESLIDSKSLDASIPKKIQISLLEGGTIKPTAHEETQKTAAESNKYTLPDGDVIYVPTAEELKKGAKIEVITRQELEKRKNAAAQKPKN
jgi:hypothetical protein